MTEPGRDLDLAQEPVGADGCGKFRPQHLDGDAAPVLEVFGEVNDRHAAGADLPLDGIAAGNCFSEALRHGRER